MRSCSKASRPRELRDSSTCGPSMMSRRKGWALRMSLQSSPPRDNTTLCSSWANTDILHWRETDITPMPTHPLWTFSILYIHYKTIPECETSIVGWYWNEQTHSSVGGSVMRTSGTSYRGLMGFSSLIFTLVMFPWRRYNSSSKSTWTQAMKLSHGLHDVEEH